MDLCGLCYGFPLSSRINESKSVSTQILTFDKPGCYTLIVGKDIPSSVSEYIVRIWGAGGSGAMTTQSSGTFYGGSGGGGAYVLLSGINTCINGKRFKLTVGAGGVFPTLAPSNGGNGKASTFKSLDNKSIHVSAGGGQGGSATYPGVVGGNGGRANFAAVSKNVKAKGVNGTAGSSGGSTSGIGGTAAFGGSAGSQGYLTNGINYPGNAPQVPGAGSAGTASNIGSVQAFGGSDGWIEIQYSVLV
jgi:hypothetical protein